ncbi:formate dehydrogenase, partial [Escherichia coli]
MRVIHRPDDFCEEGVRLENGIYGHSRFCNTDFDDKLAC